jgi:glycosyltransferase involved in cell wall biosynthesis
MRIVYVCADPGVPLLGGKGASVHVRAVTSALARRGHQVVVACAAMGSGNPPPAVDRLVALDASPERQEEALAELVVGHAADAIIERYSLGCGPARRVSATVGVPLVLEVNAPLVLEAARHRGLGDVDRWLAYERDVFVSADAIGVVSRALAVYVTDTVGGLAPRWVPNGVDPTPFEQAVPEDLGLPRGAVAVGFVGSMKAWHGVGDLVDAMHLVDRTSPAHLVLVGSGPEADRLRQQVIDRGLTDRTHFFGQVPHHRIPSLLAALDVAVAPYAPSAGFYFSPLKVLEYLAAGLPVVCPRLGDLPELVGEAGVLYRPGNVADLAAAIASLIEHPEKREASSGSAQACARRLTWDANAAAYEQLVASALTGSPSFRSASTWPVG